MSEQSNEPKVHLFFGLQKSDIEVIESTLEKFGENALFDEFIWQKLGEKLQFLPITLALRYFRYIHNKKSSDDTI